MKDIVIHTEKTKEDVRQILEDFCIKKFDLDLYVNNISNGFELRRKIHTAGYIRVGLVNVGAYHIMFTFKNLPEKTQITISRPSDVVGKLMIFMTSAMFWFIVFSLFLVGELTSSKSILLCVLAGTLITFIPISLQKLHNYQEDKLLNKLLRQII